MNTRAAALSSLLLMAACNAGSLGAPSDPDGAPRAPRTDAMSTGPDPCVSSGQCPTGVWTNVTPADMSPSVLGANHYGPGGIAADPARPSDLYVGGGDDGVWRSTDYGRTWTKIKDDVPGSPIGVTIAVAGTTPATIWVSAGRGDGSLLRSSDGGTSWERVGGGFTDNLYSLRVDPDDPRHLLSGIHEQDGVAESIDGGEHWNRVDKQGWPAGGISWFPFFIDDASAPAGKTWLAIAQDGGSLVMTHDGGDHWAIPPSISGLQHGHGCAQVFQMGTTLFAPGVYGPGQGVYRSLDTGATWSRVDDGEPQSVVWATDKAVYSMWGWACSNCPFDLFETAPQPGTAWTHVDVPAHLGATNVVVTSDGTHSIFVGVMWASGIWRYIEP